MAVAARRSPQDLNSWPKPSRSPSKPPALPMTSSLTGCRSRRTANSRRRRGCSSPPRACTTPPPTGARCSTAPPACGAAMPATAIPRSSRRSRRQAAEMDYAPAFQMGHPKAFELAARVAALAPGDLDHVFFTNSGSEAVDTALKIAIAYHRAARRGHAHPPDRPRARLSRRRLRRHVGGRHRQQPQILRRRCWAASTICRTPMTCAKQRLLAAASPNEGAHLADELERLVALHDASTIAAVIVEPVACSAGVLVPPKGYLKRLREICSKHGILLIFDEVITGFGRLGTQLRRRLFRRAAGPHHHRQRPHLRRRADGRGDRAQGASTTPSCRARSTRSSCSTATPIPAIRWPAPPASPRSTSMPRKASSRMHADARALLGGRGACA